MTSLVSPSWQPSVQTSPRIAALILAAGQSLRFGSDKRQAILPDGQSMLEAVLRRYQAVFHRVLLVAREGDDFARQLADMHGCELVISAEAELGMGHSLACGAQALMACEELAGAIVGLADMPGVATETLRDLRDVLAARQRPVVPVFQGHLGHPRGLPCAWFEALARLSGDQGARQLMDWRRAEAVHVNDPGILLDADTPEDLHKLARMATHVTGARG
ncbi:MAG: nucleotidyltransferase family protein [Aquabacterium sp.]